MEVIQTLKPVVEVKPVVDEPNNFEHLKMGKTKNPASGEPVEECNHLVKLVEGIHKAFEGDCVNIDTVAKLMESYTSNPKDWKKFAKFDRYKYTRNLVDAGNGKFNLMLLCWGPSHQSTIHDHSDAHCFMKVVAGSLEEQRFAWPKKEEAEDTPMTATGSSVLKTNEVCYINDSMGLHRVGNPSNTDDAVSLHLYCPPFDAACCFDERTGIKRKVPVTFWSEYGVRCCGQKIKPPH